MTNTQGDNAKIVRACFKSYPDKDRETIESLIGEEWIIVHENHSIPTIEALFIGGGAK